ncbi:Flp pilus assembly protein CpaB [Pseudomonas sp. M30-35]|uniref:Flp pilus assembly protein CpaB n=1 Tax=Pseudomonas sp. M30-35 TaxID=1981174 RepID=UPI000B3D38AA|nr:Flp pilus assembly protein CpaB [Pseudomonas sp. M30-35]ARU89912.1 Flp pilus assembly protein CpaB [Pseudomonas sp. M30-35]
MDSRVTMALAGVLLLGAVVAGYWGITLSQQPPASSDAAVAPQVTEQPQTLTTRIDEATDNAQRSAVVVAVKALSPFVPIKAEDVAIEQLRVAPQGSFSSIEQVVGRTSWNPIGAGTWLSQESFAAGGPLAQMIRPQERAVAVAVDEVISGGGHVRPGDYVDVLLFMQEKEGQKQQTAQVAVPAVRLLSYGQELGPNLNGQAVQIKDEDDKKKQPRAGRSVVLAVPQELVTRLMLASQAGTLRLAVRSADEDLHKRYAAGEINLVALDEKTRSLLPLNNLEGKALPRAVTNRAPRAAARSPGVQVFRGVENSWQTP